MGALTALRRMPAPAAKSGDGSIEAWFREFGGLESATGLAISQQNSLNVSTMYACVSVRSKDVARCTPRLLPIKGAKSQEPVTKHPVAKLFMQPNELQTWYEFCLQMQMSFLLKQNAYAAIIRDGRGIAPVELWPLNPDGVTMYESQDGQLFYSATRMGPYQAWQLRNLPLMIPAEDVFHLRGLTINSLYGLSTINLARDTIGLALGLEQQAARFMANGARPSGVLKSPKPLTPDTAKRLREQWDAYRSGISNAGRTAILEEGLDWQQMQLTSVDLEFIAQRKMSVEDIARYMGVPLHKLGVAGEVGKLRLDQADQSYVNSTIMPDLDMWEQKFDRCFNLAEEGLRSDFDERRLLRAEEATRINNERLAVMSGLMTPNEARALEGMQPMPGGNKLMFPVNIAALGSDVSGSPADGAGRPADGNAPEPSPGDGSAPAEDPTKDAPAIEHRASTVEAPRTTEEIA